jgi:hypothetical protein
VRRAGVTAVRNLNYLHTAGRACQSHIFTYSRLVLREIDDGEALVKSNQTLERLRVQHHEIKKLSENHLFSSTKAFE